MKRKNDLLIIFTILVFIFASSTTQVNASAEKTTYSANFDDGTVIEFHGTISPKTDFYNGYEINPHQDFNIDGYMLIKQGNKVIKSDFYVMYPLEENDISNLYELYLTTNYNGFYDLKVPVQINRVEFNPNLMCEYSIDNPLVLKSLKTSVDGYNVYSLIATKIRFFNSIGNEVGGNFKYDNLDIRYGYAKQSYTFEPNQNTTGLNYNIVKGDFLVETLPYAKAVKKYSNKIVLTFNKDYEFKNGLYGEWQDSRVFTSLKPDTKYYFYVRVKETKNYPAGTPKKINIKTLKE